MAGHGRRGAFAEKPTRRQSTEGGDMNWGAPEEGRSGQILRKRYRRRPPYKSDGATIRASPSRPRRPRFLPADEDGAAGGPDVVESPAILLGPQAPRRHEAEFRPGVVSLVTIGSHIEVSDLYIGAKKRRRPGPSL